MTYTAGQRTSRRTGLWLLGSSLLVLVAGAAAAAAAGPRASGPNGNAFSFVVTNTFNRVALDTIVITACWATGYAVRQQLAYQAGLREQAEQRARDQVAEARRASSEERLRIAREMHDVVAHTLSLIAVQAGVAGYVAVERPQEAASALSSIEQTSRGALNEMRALLGLLRAPEHAGELGPAPGLASLGDLIRRTEEAGVKVDLDVRGERPALAPGLDLAAFRVIQEAVTNVVKHAATDRCRVLVDYGPGVLSLEITDHGPGPAGGAPPRPAMAGTGSRGCGNASACTAASSRSVPGRGTASGSPRGSRWRPRRAMRHDRAGPGTGGGRPGAGTGELPRAGGYRP